MLGCVAHWNHFLFTYFQFFVLLLIVGSKCSITLFTGKFCFLIMFKISLDSLPFLL